MQRSCFVFAVFVYYFLLIFRPRVCSSSVVVQSVCKQSCIFFCGDKKNNLVQNNFENSLAEIVGNKAKGGISKRVFQEKKRQIFRKANISYPLIRTRTCAYQGVWNNHFSKNLPCFVFLKHWFVLLPYYRRNVILYISKIVFSDQFLSYWTVIVIWVHHYIIRGRTKHYVMTYL